MLEDWLAGLLQTSRHVQLHFDDVGQLQVTTENADLVAPIRCSICRLAGQGDSALFRLAEMVDDEPSDDFSRSDESAQD